MRVSLIIAMVVALATLVVIAVFALSRHKKAGSGEVVLIGQVARVDSALNPEGTILVHGELWRARSLDDSTIAADSRVRVVGFKDHLVLAKPLSDES